jgi:hypothetical protein
MTITPGRIVKLDCALGYLEVALDDGSRAILWPSDILGCEAGALPPPTSKP